MSRLTGILGIVAILLACYLFSSNRKAIRAKTVAIGLALQFLFAVLILRIGWGERAMAVAGDVVTRLLDYSFAGSEFVFGPLGAKGGKYGFILAFQVLPIIIFIAAFFAILYHFGVMQFIIRQLAKVMMRFMGASGVESMDVAASIFMGQTEAPLTVRPYLDTVTMSELMTIMTAGMAHISGAVMGAYIAFGAEARHLLAAVIMTAPGTILIAKMLVPETETPLTAGTTKLDQIPFESKDSNVLDAAAKGTTDGLHLALNVAAMLISFLAIIALIDGIFGGIHNFLAAHGMPWFPAKLETIFGVLFAHWRALARLPRYRGPARHAHGAERTGGLYPARRGESHTRSPVIYHRDLRALRLRQLQLDWHPDRRTQRPCSQPSSRPGQTWLPRHDRRYTGQPDVGQHRRHLVACLITGGGTQLAFLRGNLLAGWLPVCPNSQ